MPTDTVAVKSLASTGQAKRYAAPRGLYQVETAMVSFGHPCRSQNDNGIGLKPMKVAD